MGTGSDTVLAQIAAEVLAAPLEKISVHAADTDVSPYDPGSYASSTVYVTGTAVARAAARLREKIIQEGARFLAVGVQEVAFDGSAVSTTQGDQTISLEDLSALLATGAGQHQLVGQATFGSPVSPPPFVAGFAEVEVDRETGKTELLDYVAVVDCGTAINPVLARVQAEGGIVQGIGLAMYEEVAYNDKWGLQTNSFMQYKIPCRKDIRSIRFAFQESYEPTGPFGAKSIGEVVTNTPAPAIVHAIVNAVGARITELPVTPEKVFINMTK